jgi:hypothetical protein
VCEIRIKKFRNILPSNTLNIKIEDGTRKKEDAIKNLKISEMIRDQRSQ